MTSGCANSEVEPDCSFWILIPRVEKGSRPAQAAALKKKYGDFIGVRAGLKNDGAKFAERADKLGGECVHGFNALHVSVKLGGGFKGEIGRSLIALSAQSDEPAFAARREKAFDSRRFLSVALVRAALEAGREAHLHLGINAAGIARVWIQFKCAAAQQKQLEHLFCVALGGGARRERSVRPVSFAQAGPIRDCNSRIRIAAEKTDEGRMAQVHSLKHLCAENLLQKRKLREQRLELGTGELPFDAADEASEVQATRVLRRRLEQAVKSGAKIGRAADVRLGARVGAIKRKDRRRLRQRSQRGFGIGRIESERLKFGRHGPGPPRGARHAFAFRVILRRMRGKRTSIGQAQGSET